MTKPIIEVKKLSKQYTIGERATYGSFREEIMQTITKPFRRLTSRSSRLPSNDNTIWALKDVSFDVNEGEVLGIIGRNGAGKSTLLKILSRITDPTSGEVIMHGRVASLLEVGTGFHPELTGRENIYLNGALLGMTRQEINRKFDEIVAFSEIEKFLDTPVKRYSSGMYVRLAFAVAAHLEPEILVIDEVLSVGDAQFQKKCLGKMNDVARGGRTVLFVSHNMSAVRSLCHRGIHLKDGSVVSDNNIENTITSYLSGNQETNYGEIYFTDATSSDDRFELLAMRALDKRGMIRTDFTSSEPITIELEFSLRKLLPYLKIGIEVERSDGSIIFSSFHNDVREVVQFNNNEEHKYRLRTIIPEGILNSGLYYINPLAGIHRKEWIIKDIKGISVNVEFGVPNADYAGSKREGCIAPILDWSEMEN